MKQLAATVRRKLPNAWGRDVLSEITDYQIEECDIGRVKRHHGGNAGSFNPDGRNYTFQRSDVGRVIRDDRTHDGSWNFLFNEAMA